MFQQPHHFARCARSDRCGARFHFGDRHLIGNRVWRYAPFDVVSPESHAPEMA
jgi:hypothetical protein